MPDAMMQTWPASMKLYIPVIKMIKKRSPTPFTNDNSNCLNLIGPLVKIECETLKAWHGMIQ